MSCAFGNPFNTACGPLAVVCLAVLGAGACSFDAPSPASAPARPSDAPGSGEQTAGFSRLAQPLREQTCTPQQESACAAFGAHCVDDACNGGYAPGDGCSDGEEEACARFGAQCADHQCSGGFAPGHGCTAREELNCAAFGMQCVDHQCSGGFGSGTGCTAREQLDCAGVGCGCADHGCAGGFCPGQGCTAREQIDCAEQGLDCAEHHCVRDRAGGCSPPCGSGVECTDPADGDPAKPMVMVPNVPCGPLQTCRLRGSAGREHGQDHRPRRVRLLPVRARGRCGDVLSGDPRHAAGRLRRSPSRC